MRILLLLPALTLALVSAYGCGGSSSSSSGAGGSHGTTSNGTGTDPCAGLGCATFPGTLTLSVVDGMGQPVADPTFTEQGHPISAVCETDAGMIIQDAGTCGAWVFDQLSVGAQTITVGAPGYEPAMVSFTLQGPAGCCGKGPDVSQTVTLQPAPADAGAG
jgi:hypothetical protein